MPCSQCGRNFNDGACPFCRHNAPVVQRQPVRGPPPVVVVPLLPGALPPGAVLSFACLRPGRVTVTPVAAGAVLYVLRDTEIEFRASATGLAFGVRIDFGAAAWGGTAGLAGVGSARTLRFVNNAAANNTAIGVTITLAFGGQNVAITVIVFSLTAAPVIADDFPGRSTTDLGVDERVTLGYASLPAGVTALQAGRLRWGFEHGAAASRDTVGLLHDPATNAAPAIFDGTANYIAPGRTSAPGEAVAPRKLVTLKLEIVDGICAGLGVTLPYTVCHPVAHMRERAGQPRRHTQGLAGSGFFGEVFLTPKNVSFRTLRWRESTGALTLWGTMDDGSSGTQHGATVFGNAQHGTIGNGDINNGCVVNQLDNVCSEFIAYVVPDRASPLTKVGSADWPIIWEYTLPTLLPAPAGWTGTWIAMQRAHHKEVMYQTGAMTIFKGHVGCATNDCMPMPLRKEINDPTVP